MTKVKMQGKLKKEQAAVKVNEEHRLNDQCGKNVRFSMFFQGKHDDLNPQIV